MPVPKASEAGSESAPVPEVAIAKDGHTGSTEDEVRIAWKVGRYCAP